MEDGNIQRGARIQSVVILVARLEVAPGEDELASIPATRVIVVYSDQAALRDLDGVHTPSTRRSLLTTGGIVAEIYARCAIPRTSRDRLSASLKALVGGSAICVVITISSADWAVFHLTFASGPTLVYQRAVGLK